MSTKRLSLSIAAGLLSSTALASADVPNVAVDIAPIHSLVARVMDGVGTPNLIIPAGASPHEYSLRPSEAQALQDADLVFWMGEDLTPWLEDAVETLAEDASVTTLLEADETELLEFREGALFEGHDHGDHDDHDHSDEHAHDDDHDHDHDDHDHGDEHAHDDDHDHDHDDHDHGDEHAHDDDHDHDHDDHDHDDEHAHDDDHDHDDHDHGDEHAHDDDHDHDHDDHDHDDEHAHDDEHGHDHGEHDPHAWLSPDNAAAWLNVIAAQLSAADPDNAGAYFANAAAGQEEMAALKDEVSDLLDPVRGSSFVVFHDAYQYFEVAFDFSASGAIALGDAADPSPARIAEIQERVTTEGVDCVLSEPQYNPGLVATVLDGTDAATGVIDPLGSSLEPGPDLYPQVIRGIAATLVDCL